MKNLSIKGFPTLKFILAVAILLVFLDLILLQERFENVWYKVLAWDIVLSALMTGLTLFAIAEYKSLKSKSRLDPLTGLLNRAAFSEVINDRCVDNEPHSILIAGIDRFKNVNDVLGYEAGDELLNQSVARLQFVVSNYPNVQLARIGGDEFGILIDCDTEEAELLAVLINELFRQPFTVQGHDTELSISIGIVTYPSHGSNVSALTRCADIAMFKAKKAKVGYVVYDLNDDTSNVEDLSIRAHLRTAIEKNEIVVEYQPKVDAKGSIVGMEALMRWKHPVLGLLSPDRFIPVAEHCGMIHQLTDFVLNKALSDFEIAREAGVKLKNVSVNVSPFSAFNSKFMVSVCSAIAAAKVEPDNLVMEVTETSLIHTADSLIRTLVGLNSIGVIISIDDFGTGQSSLLYLKSLPVKEIKIDRSFVNNLTKNGPDASIVKSVISLAKELGCMVCAEGVEDKITRDELVQLGCDYMQGYLVSKPVPLQEIIRRFSNES